MGNKYILCSQEFGFNTFYIKNHFPELQIVKPSDPRPDPEWIIRWGYLGHVDNGPKMINKRKAMRETCNKGAFRLKANAAGLTSGTWSNGTAVPNDAFPVIVRPQFHSRSEHLFFCETRAKMNAAIAQCGADYYISQYVKKDREVRVFVAQGRAFIMAEKNPKNKNDVTWGCVEDGTLDYVFWQDWDNEIIECAIKAFNLSGLDFAAVDIMVQNGKPYFLECNTAPEVWAYYGECFAKVFKYMIENGRERIPVPAFDHWKKMIHPAMTDKAILS